MSHTNTTDYLVEMKFQPLATVPTPAEALAFAERFVLPTLEQCERLAQAGTIVAGGPTVGATGFTFVVRVETVQQVEEVVTALPSWPRAQTTVTPLGTFARRAALARERIAAVKAAVEADRN